MIKLGGKGNQTRNLEILYRFGNGIVLDATKHRHFGGKGNDKLVRLFDFDSITVLYSVPATKLDGFALTCCSPVVRAKKKSLVLVWLIKN